MKLSFSLPPKAKSKCTVRPISDENGVDFKEFVTEFDPSETLSAAKPKYVIPPVEGRRQINNNIEFEAAEIPSHVSDNITYGLNLRQKVPKTEPVEKLLLKSLRNDLKSLPDAPALEDFENVPVEGFGAALLAGYGWRPGQGIGLKAKEDVQIVEYNKRSGNEGFGFNPRVKGSNAKGKQEESRRKTVEKCHEIEDVEKYRKVRVKSSNSKAEEEEESGRKVTKGREIDKCHEIDNVEKYRKVSGTKAIGREKVSWLRSHIRVRIISKDLKGGRLYLKKGVVTDVVGPTTCDVTMDEKQELVQGIDQELLETALPRRGGPVLVLSGRHKGVYGSLFEKDLDEETGVVRDADRQEMVHVKLDQIAEYIGDPGDIGY